jgi:exportin-1
MDKIDPSHSDIDIGYLDSVVKSFYEDHTQVQFISSPQHKQAAALINAFQSHPDAWRHAYKILTQSNYLQTKYLALQILDSLISTAWKVLSPENRSGIKDYIVSVIINTSSTEDSLDKNKLYLAKLNMVLVQVLSAP